MTADVPDLAALDALHNAATPGPWTLMGGMKPGHQRITNAAAIVIADLYWGGDEPAPDAALIVALRNAYPGLARMIRERDDEIERLRGRVEWLAPFVEANDGLGKALVEERAEIERLRDSLALTEGEAVRTITDLRAEVERMKAQVLTWMNYGTEQNKAGWAEHEARVIAEAAISRVQAIEPEDHATSSRDYGRGFAEAIRLVREALELTTEADDVEYDPICICDAYAPDKRPGKCPIHGRTEATDVE